MSQEKISSERKPFKVSEKDLEWIEAKPPYDRRFFRNFFESTQGQFKASLFIERFEPGAESYPHVHSPPAVEIFYSMKGTGICELVSQDQKFVERYTLAPGDAVYGPENWTHKVRNASDKEEWLLLGIVIQV